MQEHDTYPGKVYAVTCASGCTITDNKGRTLGECEAGKQALVVATSDKLLTSADALVTATFNSAPTIGSGGGGGVTIQFDTTPTQDSTNAVTSGGLYNMLVSPIKLGDGSTGVNTTHIALGNNISFGGNSDNSVSIGNNSKILANSNKGVAIGFGATIESNSASCIAVGPGAKALQGSVSIGANTSSIGFGTVCGMETTATNFSSAFGSHIKVKDQGCTVISAWNTSSGSWIKPTIQSLLYLMGAGSPLATTYENGEACLGYVVKDSSGNILACGTRKLSELLTNNTAFAPAALDLDAPAPTPFLPTGIMEPIEIENPEDLTV